jgi:hypothetical protein
MSSKQYRTYSTAPGLISDSLLSAVLIMKAPQDSSVPYEQQAHPRNRQAASAENETLIAEPGALQFREFRSAAQTVFPGYSADISRSILRNPFGQPIKTPETGARPVLGVF